MMKNLVFLKLGGSLITDKSSPNTARGDVIARLAAEIAAARSEDEDLRLLLGHGSGSFGHVPAKTHGTRSGVNTADGWQGFVEVWRAAAALNRIVLDALAAAGIRAVNFPPSAAASAAEGRVVTWNSEPIEAALEAGFVPVVFGDVAFDRSRGGTILSTEDVFAYLAGVHHPDRVLIAGIEPGVWADYPAQTRILPAITPDSFEALAGGIRGSTEVDVTGGMRGKVEQLLDLVRQQPGLGVRIFGGLEPGSVRAALRGEKLGTWIHAP